MIGRARSVPIKALSPPRCLKSVSRRFPSSTGRFGAVHGRNPPAVVHSGGPGPPRPLRISQPGGPMAHAKSARAARATGKCCLSAKASSRHPPRRVAAPKARNPHAQKGSGSRKFPRHRRGSSIPAGLQRERGDSTRRSRLIRKIMVVPLISLPTTSNGTPGIGLFEAPITIRPSAPGTLASGVRGRSASSEARHPKWVHLTVCQRRRLPLKTLMVSCAARRTMVKALEALLSGPAYRRLLVKR